MEVVGQLGGKTWCNLGDCDLALHLRRTELLRQGRCLSEVVADLATRLGVAHPLVPMTDAPAHGRPNRRRRSNLSGIFRASPRRASRDWRSLRRRGECGARVRQIAALADPLLRGIVVAPSNPILSTSPILAVAGLKEAIRARGVYRRGVAADRRHRRQLGRARDRPKKDVRMSGLSIAANFKASISRSSRR